MNHKTNAMNAYSMIPHRMFVAALSGGSNAHAPHSGAPLHVHVDPPVTSAGTSIEEKRRSKAVSAIATRRVFELGPRYGI